MSKVVFSPATVTRANVAEARAEAPEFAARISNKIGRFVIKDGKKLLVLNGATLANIDLPGLTATIELEAGSENNLDDLPLAEGEELATIEVRLLRLWDFVDSRNLNITPLIPSISLATLFDDAAWDQYPKAEFQHEIIDAILPDLVERACAESQHPMVKLLAMLKAAAADAGVDLDDKDGRPSRHTLH